MQMPCQASSLYRSAMIRKVLVVQNLSGDSRKKEEEKRKK
jgi:hypothetical protein